MSEHEPDRVRQEQILQAVLKVVGIALGIGLVIGLGTWVLVKAIGLDSADTSAGPIQVDPIAPAPLPTTAIPQPSASQPDPTETETTDEPSSTPTAGAKALALSASPSSVGAMQRINLTGQWPGRDAVSLLVQRFESGEWVDFGVQVQVQLGTYETYVETSREGANRFRVYDPTSDTASNPVTVTVKG